MSVLTVEELGVGCLNYCQRRWCLSSIICLQKGKMATRTGIFSKPSKSVKRKNCSSPHSASCPLVAVRAQTAPIIFKKPRTNNSLSLIYFSFLSFILKGNSSDIYFTPNKRCVWLILLATCHKSWRQTLFHCHFGFSMFVWTFSLKPLHVSWIVSTRSQFFYNLKPKIVSYKCKR